METTAPQSVNPQSLIRFALFADLEPSELEKVAAMMQDLSFPNNAYFIQEDTDSRQVFFIVQGKVQVEIRRVKETANEVIATLDAGDTVGEFVLVRGGRRSASARALGSVRVLAADAQALFSIFEQHPNIGYKVHQNLAKILVKRIEDTNLLSRNVLMLGASF